MIAWKQIIIPETPSASYVIVKNISPESSEKTVREFFVFCGSISEFELTMDEDNQYQVALIRFERESAAVTATLLSNALIDDCHIVATHYFKADEIKESSSDSEESKQESKPKSRIVAEILANGYLLQDQVVAKGLEYDSKYHVSILLGGYISALTLNMKQMDEKYRIWDKAVGIDHRFKLQEKVQTAAQTANAALQSPTGQKVHDFASQAFAQIAAVHYEAKKIQSEKMTLPAAPSA